MAESTVHRRLTRAQSGPRLLSEDARRQLHQSKLAIEKELAKSSYAIGFCGCSHGSGVSTIALNFFDAAVSGERMKSAVIEANTHSPTFVSTLRCESGPGFVDFLSGKVDYRSAMLRTGNMHVMPAGNVNADSSDFPSDDRYESAMAKLREAFDVLVLDLPPIGLYPEAAALSAVLDGVVLVLEAEHDRWEVAEQAKQALLSSGGKLIGAVLNKKPHHIPDWLYRLL